MIDFREGVIFCKVRLEGETEDDLVWAKVGIDITTIIAVEDALEYRGTSTITTIGGPFTVDIEFEELVHFWLQNRHNVFLLKNN